MHATYLCKKEMMNCGEDEELNTLYTGTYGLIMRIKRLDYWLVYFHDSHAQLLKGTKFSLQTSNKILTSNHLWKLNSACSLHTCN